MTTAEYNNYQISSFVQSKFFISPGISLTYKKILKVIDRPQADQYEFKTHRTPGDKVAKTSPPSTSSFYQSPRLLSSWKYIGNTYIWFKRKFLIKNNKWKNNICSIFFINKPVYKNDFERFEQRSSTIKTHKAVARHIGDQIQITEFCCHCKPGRRKKCQI